MRKEEKELRIHLDTTSNIMQLPDIRKQIEKELRNNFEKELPNRLKRMGEIPSFITADVGVYSKLLDEAKECYKLGLYHATIAMVGITAERFAIELFEKIKFKINESEIIEKNLFGAKIQKQKRRINLLEKSHLLKPKYAEKLKEVYKIRNKYVHPKEEGDAKEDSLKILKLYIKIISSRFSDEWIIKEGKLVKKVGA